MRRRRWILLLTYEWRLLTRSRAAAVVFPVLAAVCVAAAWNGAQFADEWRRASSTIEAADARAYAQIYAELADLERRGDPRPALQLAGTAWYLYQPQGAEAPAPHIDPRRPEAAASEWIGARHAMLPAPPFASLALGQSDLHPRYMRVTIRTRPILLQNDEIENPATLLSGRIDLAFVMLACWPLLALPLLYNVRSEDRDNGTLAVLAAQPIALGIVLALRLVLRGGVLAAVTIAASLAGLAAWGRLVDVPPSAVVAWMAIVVATAVFWCGVAAAINATRWRSATNAAAFTACWLAAVIIAPAAIAEIAALAAPVPSRIELINAVRQTGNLNPAQLTELVSQYYADNPDAKPGGGSADASAIRGLAQQDAVDRLIDPILSEYRAAIVRQQALTDRLRYASPPVLLYEAAVELAGTTARRHHAFAEQVDAFHQRWREYFYPLVHTRQAMTRALYERAPRFGFVDGNARMAVTEAVRLLLLPLAVGVALLVGACSVNALR
jgi:ABC-2 type transport system permease protein